VALRVFRLRELVLVDLPKHLSNVHRLDVHDAKHQVDLVDQLVYLVSDNLMDVEVK